MTTSQRPKDRPRSRRCGSLRSRQWFFSSRSFLPAKARGYRFRDVRNDNLATSYRSKPPFSGTHFKDERYSASLLGNLVDTAQGNFDAVFSRE